jgi:hypothetical protein
MLPALVCAALLSACASSHSVASEEPPKDSPSTSSSTASTSTASTSGSTEAASSSEQRPAGSEHQPPGQRRDNALTGEGTLKSGAARLVDLRVGLHERHDRVVFEFKEGVPPYEISSVQGLILQAGSGRPADIEGNFLYAVDLKSANAHDTESGGGAVFGEVDCAGLENVVEVEVVSDYEGQVEVGVGLKLKVTPTAQVLDDPPRLVVDFPHR